jgi:hypothetical protein
MSWLFFIEAALALSALFFSYIFLRFALTRCPLE